LASSPEEGESFQRMTREKRPEVKELRALE